MSGKNQVTNDDLLKVISEILDEMDDSRSHLEGGYWWKHSFVEGLDVSDYIKSKLGFPPEGYEEDI